VKVSDVTQSDLFIGLSITDTALLGGITDGIYWRNVDASTDFKAATEKDSTETESASLFTLVDDTFVTIGLLWNGTSTIIPYVNGVAQAALADTNRPDDEELTPSIEILAGEAAAKILDVSFFDCYQIR